MPKLVASLQEQAVRLTILILDNASTAESFTPLEQLQDARVQLLRSEKNLGFAGGVNFAFQYALKYLESFQYVFFFNPDALSRPNLVGDLADLLQRNPQAAGISPKILYLNENPWYAGATLNYKVGKVFNNAMLAQQNKQDVFEVDVFSGCAVLFDAEKIGKAGGLNEDLFMYYDEADFSIKLHRLGFTLLYAPHLVIYHDVSYTTRHISHLKTYYMTRNRFLVFGNTMNLYNKVYFLTHDFLFHLKNRRFRNIYYLVKGYLDYKRGVRGQLKTYAN